MLEADFVPGTLHTFAGFVREADGEIAFRQSAEEALDVLMEAIVTRIGDQLVEVSGNCADIFGDAPFVVVENSDEPFGGIGDVVESFEGDSVCERGIAENADDMFVRSAFITGRGHSKGG